VTSIKQTNPNDTSIIDSDGIGVVLPQAQPLGSDGTVIFDTTQLQGYTYYSFDGATLGQSFYVGAGTHTLTDVKFDLQDPNYAADTGTISVELFYSTGGTDPSPGAFDASLGAIPDSSLTANPTLVDVPVTTGITLSADTQYWIVLSEQTPNAAGWYGPDDLSGATGASNQYFSIDGTTFSDQSNQSRSPFAFGMQVTVDGTCYAAGTHILTDRCEMCVEQLRPGDHVITARSGRPAEIRWIGRRNVDVRHHPRPENIGPVRIVAGAFDKDLPHRDLLLSPDHAVFIDGSLIAVRYLINGATIRQDTRDRITYYHIELDSHDVVLAEGLPVETYLDIGNRSAFRDSGGAIALHPDFVGSSAARRIWDEKACAPSLTDPAARAALHKTLLDRAVECGHRTTNDPDLYALAGGDIVRPDMTGDRAMFRLPPGTERLYLISRSVIPRQLALPGGDGRRLGIGVTAIELDGARVALNDQRLATGWHVAEPTLRWTDGVAGLATNGATTLSLRLHPGLTYWADAQPAQQFYAA
jgi:hypothetical protein